MLFVTHYQNKNGFILPTVLIILVFCSIIIYTVSMQVNRAMNRIETFRAMSGVQNTAANITELALGYLVKNYLDSSFEDEWQDFDKFVEFVSSRSGLEGDYWKDSLEKLAAEECWDLSKESNFTELLEELSWANGYDVGAVIYKHGTSNYIVIGWAKKSGIEGYSLGIAAVEKEKLFPVLSFGTIEREFSELKSAKRGYGVGNRVFTGDLLYGPVTVLGKVEIAKGNDPANIFMQGIAAHEVEFSKGYDFDYTKISTPVEAYLSDLREKYLDEFNSYESVELYLDSPIVPDLTPTSVLEVYPPSSEDPVLIEFDGGEIKLGANGLSLVTIPEKDFELNIRIHGNAVFDYNMNTTNLDAQKAQKIDGNFKILVEGDITLHSNLIYDSLYADFNNGNGGSPVVNHAINSVKDFVVGISSKEIAESLTIISVGGDIIITYGQGVSGEGNASHGVRVLNGRFFALPDEDGEGGTFRFPDIGTVLSGNRTSQLFVVGSLIGEKFGAPEDNIDEYLNMLVAVSDRTDSDTLSEKKLRFIGMRVW